MKFSKQLGNQEKVLLVVLSIVILAAIYILCIFQPVNQSLSRLALEQADADDQVMVLEIKAQRLADMRAELETIQADPDVAAIPSYDNLQQVMIFLNSTLAASTDYALSFQQVQIPEEGSIIRRTIHMTFQCASYASARSVVEALHASPYRCQLGNLSMSPAANTGGTDWSGDLTRGAVSVGLSITFFEWKEK